MSGNRKKSLRRSVVLPRRQRGVSAIEFSFLCIIFLTLVFGILEIARAMYLFNTLQEVTRRAAAMASNSRFDEASINTVRSQAMFADNSGKLIFGDPITPDHVQIEYLSISRDAATGALTPQVASPMPSCAARTSIA